MGSIAPADGDGDGDIEAEISKELDGLRNSRRRALFQPVRLDVKCGKYRKASLGQASLTLSAIQCFSSELGPPLSLFHSSIRSVRTPWSRPA